MAVYQAICSLGGPHSTVYWKDPHTYYCNDIHKHIFPVNIWYNTLSAKCADICDLASNK